MFKSTLKALLIILVCFSAPNLFAQLSDFPGSVLVNGVPAENDSPYSFGYFPAYPPSQLKQGVNSFDKMMILGIEGYYEVGDVQDLDKKFETIRDNIANNATLSFASVNDLRNQVENLADELDKDGFFYSELKGNFLTPVSWHSSPAGALVLEANYRGGFGGNFEKGNSAIRVGSDFDECITFLNNINDLVAGADCFNAISNSPTLSSCVTGGASIADQISNCAAFRLESDSVGKFRAYHGMEAIVTYANHLFTFNQLNSELFKGEFFYSFNLNYYSLTTYQFNYVIEDYVNNANINDLLKDNEKKSSLFDLGLGFKFSNNHYDLMMNLNHLTSPEVKYLVDNVKLDPNITLGLSLKDLLNSPPHNVTFNLYADLGEQTTLYGVKNQWFLASLDYNPSNRFIPGLRLGRRYNLKTNRSQYTQFGLSFGQFFDLNIAMSDESLKYENDDIFRSFFFNLSFYWPS